MSKPHPFDPLTFYNATGERPIETDWCGHWADRSDTTTFCGQLASDPVHETALPRPPGGYPGERLGPGSTTAVTAAVREVSGAAMPDAGQAYARGDGRHSVPTRGATPKEVADV